MELTRGCSPSELAQMMDTYGTMVYRLAYSQLRSAADADDIYQEVFLRYYQKRPEFESEEHRRAWLLRVTINRAKSYVTSAWFRHTVPLEECISLQEPEEQKLDEALGELQPKDRMLLYLFYYEDCSIREIAQLLQRKESTVRTQLTRARQRLGKILKGEDDDESNLSENNGEDPSVGGSSGQGI